MNNREYKETKLLSTQLYTLLFSLISVLVSILLTYNQKLSIEKKKTIFNTNESRNISLYNRILITLIAIVFLYVNFKQYILDRDTNNKNNLRNDELQVYASIITIVASLITVYVAVTSSNNSISDIENPII